MSLNVRQPLLAEQSANLINAATLPAAARKELGSELGVHAGEDGTAEQNIALHKAVMAKLAENGGVVPDSLRG